MWINLYEIDFRKPIISTTAMLVLAAVVFMGMIIFLVKTKQNYLIIMNLLNQLKNIVYHMIKICLK